MLPRVQLQQSAAHEAALHALQAVAPPVETGQVVDLLVEEGVARAEGVPQLLLQSVEPGRVFAQREHHGVVIFGCGPLAVLEGVHFRMLLTGRGAWTVRAPGVRAYGVERLRTKLRRSADRHRTSVAGIGLPGRRIPPGGTWTNYILAGSSCVVKYLRR
jgi:hypothetical protein